MAKVGDNYIWNWEGWGGGDEGEGGGGGGGPYSLSNYQHDYMTSQLALQPQADVESDRLTVGFDQRM